MMSKTFIAFVNAFNVIGCALWAYNYYHVRKDRKELERLKKEYKEELEAHRKLARALNNSKCDQQFTKIERVNRPIDPQLSDYLEEQERSRQNYRYNPKV